MQREEWLDCGLIIDELGEVFSKLIRFTSGKWWASTDRASSGICDSPIEALNVLKSEEELIAAKERKEEA